MCASEPNVRSAIRRASRESGSDCGRMLDWLGLDWDDGCLKFHESARPVRTASVVQVREPVYRRSVGRWRGYEPFLHKLFEQLPVSVEP